jgi:integrase
MTGRVARTKRAQAVGCPSCAALSAEPSSSTRTTGRDMGNRSRQRIQGSVFERGGKWGWRADAIAGPQVGKRRQRSRQGYATEKEAQEALQRFLLARPRHLDDLAPREDMALRDFLEQWIASKEDPEASQPIEATTADGYRTSASQICRYVGDVIVRKLTTAQLDQTWARLRKDVGPRGRSLSKKSVANAATMLRTALDDAVTKGLADRNVARMSKPPRCRTEPVRRDRHWNPDEVRRFLAHAIENLFFVAFVLAATTGMRRGEVLGARWSNLDFNTGRLVIDETYTTVGNVPISKGVKTDASDRVIFVDQRTLEVLAEWRQTQSEHRAAARKWAGDDYIVTLSNGSRPHPDQVSRAFNAAVARCPGLRRICFHGLRHTWATSALLHHGADPATVASQLGHANENVTRMLYKHALPDQKKETVNAVASAFWG